MSCLAIAIIAVGLTIPILSIAIIFKIIEQKKAYYIFDFIIIFCTVYASLNCTLSGSILFYATYQGIL